MAMRRITSRRRTCTGVVRIGGMLLTTFLLCLGVTAWADTAVRVPNPPAVDTGNRPSEPPPAPPATEQPIVSGAGTSSTASENPEEVAPEEEFLPDDKEASSLEDRWTEAVDSVAEKIVSGQRTPEDADALFVELVNDLQPELKALRTYIREDRTATERVVLAYERARQLYETRIRLLDLTTPEFRIHATGARSTGLLELRLELRYLATYLLYQTLRIPQDT